MRRTLCQLGILILTAPLLAQTPPAVPAADPALPEHLKELKSLVGEPKMTSDFQAIGLMQKLTGNLEQRNPKDKERIAKAIGDVFRTGKVRPAEKDVIYREASDCLSKLGEDGAKELAKAVDDARFKDAFPLQAHMLLALGRTQDEKQVERLLDVTTRSPRDELRAAAGEALGSYTSLDVKLRREVVKGIVREWGSLHSRATTVDNPDPNAPIDPGPQNARKTLREVEGKWNATLQKLTGTSWSQFTDWQRWLNKNPNWTPPDAPKKS